MISPIVVCRVAPMVRLILTKSYTPATLCTVPQRTSQQSEKHLFWFSFFSETSLPHLLARPLPMYFRWQVSVTSHWLDHARQVPGFAQRQNKAVPCQWSTSPRLFTTYAPSQHSLLVLFADLKCFSDASKPLIIRCEHYRLQTVLTHTLIRLPKHFSYLLLTIYYIEYT